ncbi:MAG TPA: hypothetical protein VF033_02160 [Steroidobacteraceae bacterium]|jgi:hypothetical protein
MHKTLPIAAAMLLGVLHAIPAAAASPHPCTAVQDDRERLACYDLAFGTPAAPKPMPEPLRAAPPPEKFSAKVSEIEWRNGVFVVTLDNGDVWIQSERDSRVQPEAGETVTVRRASLGSYLLSGRQGIAARVKQVR